MHALDEYERTVRPLEQTGARTRFVLERKKPSVRHEIIQPLGHLDPSRIRGIKHTLVHRQTA